MQKQRFSYITYVFLYSYIIYVFLYSATNLQFFPFLQKKGFSLQQNLLWQSKFTDDSFSWSSQDSDSDIHKVKHTCTTWQPHSSNGPLASAGKWMFLWELAWSLLPPSKHPRELYTQLLDAYLLLYANTSPYSRLRYRIEPCKIKTIYIVCIHNGCDVYKCAQKCKKHLEFKLYLLRICNSYYNYCR